MNCFAVSHFSPNLFDQEFMAFIPWLKCIQSKSSEPITWGGFFGLIRHAYLVEDAFTSSFRLSAHWFVGQRCTKHVILCKHSHLHSVFKWGSLRLFLAIFQDVHLPDMSDKRIRLSCFDTEEMIFSIQVSLPITEQIHRDSGGAFLMGKGVFECKKIRGVNNSLTLSMP